MIETHEDTSTLEDAIGEALGSWQGQQVEIRERDSDGERIWTGHIDRAVATHDHTQGGLVVRIAFTKPSTGEQAKTIEFAAGRVVASSFGRGAHEPHDTLTVIEGGADGARHVSVALPRPRETLAPEPEQAPVNPRHIDELDRALDSFLRAHRGQHVLVRTSHAVGETGGRLDNVVHGREGFTVLLGELEIEIPHAGLNGATKSDRGFTVWSADHQIIFRVPEQTTEDVVGTEGFGIC